MRVLLGIIFVWILLAGSVFADEYDSAYHAEIERKVPAVSVVSEARRKALIEKWGHIRYNSDVPNTPETCWEGAKWKGGLVGCIQDTEKFSVYGHERFAIMGLGLPETVRPSASGKLERPDPPLVSSYRLIFVFPNVAICENPVIMKFLKDHGAVLPKYSTSPTSWYSCRVLRRQDQNTGKYLWEPGETVMHIHFANITTTEEAIQRLPKVISDLDHLVHSLEYSQSVGQK